MCGRFMLSTGAEALKSHFQCAGDYDFAPHVNIAPGMHIPVITGGAGGRDISLMRWGLIPHWAKEHKTGYKMFNARAETVGQKPAFRDAFRLRRCLVPAGGFYEWRREDGRKSPMLITIPGKPLFAFAGIWDRWTAPQGAVIHSCSIITVPANAFMRDIHDRMPVLLTGERDYQMWLEAPPAAVKELLQPYQGAMEAYRVSEIVNKPGVNSPLCVARAGE